MRNLTLSRRRALLGGAALAALAVAGIGRAAEPTHIAITKGPNCTCCDGWARHLREAGYSVSVVESPELSSLKARLEIPADLRTCHTAQVGNYVLEGHVPALAVRQLLDEKPAQVTGLAVPGMPVGSPGMEADGAEPEEYSVIVFGPTGRKIWNRFKGVTEING
ncbi:MAG TPA: DUF411 domain-containing protein [Xanthobacteraceae bacterium]|jgi:hypothetical protein